MGAVSGSRILPFLFQMCLWKHRITSAPQSDATNTALGLRDMQCSRGAELWLTTVLGEALVAQFAQSLKAVVQIPHFLLQVRVLPVQLGLFGVPLQRRDHILVDFCAREEKIKRRAEENLLKWTLRIFKNEAFRVSGGNKALLFLRT